MGRLLDVDWEELNKISSNIESQANSLKELENKYNDFLNSLDAVWSGNDASNFKENGLKLSYSLKNEITYLNTWHDFLLKSSEKYNGIVDNFLLKLNEIETGFNE